MGVSVGCGAGWLCPGVSGVWSVRGAGGLAGVRLGFGWGWLWWGCVRVGVGVAGAGVGSGGVGGGVRAGCSGWAWPWGATAVGSGASYVWPCDCGLHPLMERTPYA